MYYSIGEAAQRMHLSAPTLRYYDKEGLLPFVDRSAGGARMFKESDFEWLRLIECLKMCIRDRASIRTNMPVAAYRAHRFIKPIPSGLPQ